MIELKTKVHDRYSVEFKMGFVAGDQPHERDFSVGMWIFIPGSLDITPATFTNAEFYRSVKSNIRLITPSFKLRDIISGEALPLRNVMQAATDEEFEYQLKLFCAIVKSSLRDARDTIIAIQDEAQKAKECDEYVADCRAILDKFDSLRKGDCQFYCGEFLCGSMCRYANNIIRAGVSHEGLLELLRYVDEYQKSHGYARVTPDDAAANRDYIHRRGVLKKYVESILFLRVPKKRDGMIVEQAYYSLAAGMAMLFATVVAWAFQRHFGNLTWPLFIALIISYMMKDRIKELMRYWFAHRVNDKYFDNKARMTLRSHRIGELKEAMDFIPHSKIPAEIDSLRNKVHLFDAEDYFLDENVILYRKKVHLDRDMMEQISTYSFSGVNDIIRLQVRPFLRKMDDPETTVSVLDADGNLVDVSCEKDYFINFILQYHYGDVTEYHRFRMTLNRDGIKALEELA